MAYATVEKPAIGFLSAKLLAENEKPKESSAKDFSDNPEGYKLVDVLVV